MNGKELDFLRARRNLDLSVEWQSFYGNNQQIFPNLYFVATLKLSVASVTELNYLL